MDSLTHGLASFALARGFFPKAGRPAVIAAIAAGTLADLDWLSVLLGPSAYFAANRVYGHSLLSAVALAGLAAWISARFLARPEDRRVAIRTGLVLTLGAAALHALLDAGQAEGAALLWPIRSKRIALDWLPGLDPWILGILLAFLLVPALLHLVTDEIGVRAKGPRGRGGAVAALVVIALYCGARGYLHGTAVAALEARNYRGQGALRAAAYAAPVSLLSWNGIVETESALHRVIVPAGPGSNFDAEAGAAIFKPEGSTLLEAAREATAAKRFLAVARFPKATIEKTATGNRVELRDLRYAASGETDHAVAVEVELNADGKVRKSSLVWEKDLPR